MLRFTALVKEEEAIRGTKSQTTEKTKIQKNSQGRVASRKLRRWIKLST